MQRQDDPRPYWSMLCRQLTRYALLAVAMCLTACLQLAHGAAVCRTNGFVGMEAHARRGNTALLSFPTTEALNKAVVYVEHSDGTAYYHSNFVSAGKDDSGKKFLPTKVQGKPSEDAAFADVATVFRNIVGDADFANANADSIDVAVTKDVQFLVDISVFDEGGVPRIDFGKASRFQVVNMGVQVDPIAALMVSRKSSARGDKRPVDYSKASLSLGPAESLITAKPPPSIIAKIKGCCLFGRPPHRIGAFSQELSNKRFDAKRVKVASLVIDSGTSETLNASPLIRSSRVFGDSEAVKGNADLARILDAARGSTLILLAHVEGSEYVMRTSNGTVQFQVPIQQIRDMARERRVSLIDVGCVTTSAILTSSFGFGVMSRYRPVEAVKSIERAMSVAKNHEEFLAGMASDGLKIVLDQSYFENEHVTSQATIYSRILRRSQDVWVKVAQVSSTEVPAAWYIEAANRVVDYVRGFWE